MRRLPNSGAVRHTTHTLRSVCSVATLPLLPRTRPPDHDLIHLSIVHRHGDRTPITPLTNEDYWKSTLPLDGATPRRRDDGEALDDVDPEGQEAVVRGEGQVYGQLTAKGCDQLQAVGALLRSRLIESEEYTGPEIEDID